MGRYTLTYESKEAGQQISGSTLFFTDTDDHATAIAASINNFQVANAWKALNTADYAVPEGSLTMAGTAEAVAFCKYGDNSYGPFHIPWVPRGTSIDQFASAIGVDVGQGIVGGPFVVPNNAAGSPIVDIVRYSIINKR